MLMKLYKFVKFTTTRLKSKHYRCDDKQNSTDFCDQKASKGTL